MWGFFEKKPEPVIEKQPEPKQREPVNLLAANLFTTTGYVVPSKVFNGEKTAGELGMPINLVMDHTALRARAYEANDTSPIIRIIAGKFFKWVVGSGLKLQAEPSETVLKLEGVNLETSAFVENVEAYFGLYANGKRPSHNGMYNLHDLASQSFETAFLGGDCLVILRVDEDDNVTVQVVDGQQVQTPFFNDEIENAKERGNTIIHGIEIDSAGKHIAFHVRVMKIGELEAKFERIEAYGKDSGCLMAWMVYGDKSRIDHHRGVPRISTILELIAKLDRFTEASVAAAEERAKLVWTIEHDSSSTGENVLDNLRRAHNRTEGEASSYELAGPLANKISLTEGRTAYNMPIGAKFNVPNSNFEVNYDAFFKAIFLQLCAAIDVPPEVAVQQYNSNYSASRAAINAWDFIIKIYRQRHVDKFYKPVYDLWLYVHILKGKVRADEYLQAKIGKNADIVEAYSRARFQGSSMPHIDPLKEIKAIRAMLGDETTPLTDYDGATEMLNNGDFAEVMKKVKKQREDLPELMETQKPKENAAKSEIAE